MIKNGCDPELRLGLGSYTDSRPAESSSASRVSRVEDWFGNLRYNPQEQQQKQITIFYNGRICVCDVTEIQARAIISMAKREMDENITKNNQHQQQLSSLPPPLPSQSHSPAPDLKQLLNNPGLSMKRSLQRFLQKRKVRLDTASPYSGKHQLLFLIKS